MIRRIGVTSHPWLAATAPILLLAAVNISQIEVRALTLPIALALAFATLVFVAARPLVKSWQGAAVMSTLVMFCFFAHGHVFSSLPVLRGDTGHAVLGGLSLVGTLIMLAALRRVPERGPRLSRAVFPFVALFFLLSAAQLTRAALSRPDLTPASVGAIPAGAKGGSGEGLPDIYYLVLDGYARADRLQEDYAFDNSAFLDHLRDEGFFVADESRSNYAMTFLSLASSLNMRYLDAEVARLGPDATSRHQLYGLIKNNLVGRYLQAQGYHYVHINTNWGGTESSRIADSSYPQSIAEFYDILIGTTALEPLADELGMRHGGQIRRQLDAITATPELGGPKFVFAHLICPHPPFCFDKDGRQRLVSTDKGWSNLAGYVGQVQFINAEMKRIIKQIKQQSTRPPVILIQADHGAASHMVNGGPAEQNVSLQQERMPILNAYHVPPACRQRLYPGITPVNTFRLLFNELFGDEQLEPLQDISYFSWYERPYDLVDMTDQLR